MRFAIVLALASLTAGCSAFMSGMGDEDLQARFSSLEVATRSAITEAGKATDAVLSAKDEAIAAKDAMLQAKEDLSAGRIDPSTFLAIVEHAKSTKTAVDLAIERVKETTARVEELKEEGKRTKDELARKQEENKWDAWDMVGVVGGTLLTLLTGGGIAKAGLGALRASGPGRLFGARNG